MKKNESMTSRERVIAAINCENVDRIPIDLGAHTATGISVFAYKNLREYLNLEVKDIEIIDMVQCTAKVDEDVLGRFNCDLIALNPPCHEVMNWNVRDDYNFVIPKAANPTLDNEGFWHIKQDSYSMKMSPNGYFFDGDWLSNWGIGSEAERLALYGREAERIYKESDYATLFNGSKLGVGFRNFGAGEIEDAMLAFEDPEELHAKREATLQMNLERVQKVIDSFGKYIQIISFSDDIGAQNNLLCSPDYLREFCLPYYKRFNDFVHQNSDIKIFLHSCGSVRPIIGDLIESSFDILNPIQISAANMDPKELSETFGKKICFWGGGCNTQHVLGSESPEYIREHVKSLMGIYQNKSGYVFNQVHNIMGDVKAENIVAMLDAAYEFSFK